MSDDLSKKRPQDATKVNVNESWESNILYAEKYTEVF